jgi:hypothetical protein
MSVISLSKKFRLDQPKPSQDLKFFVLCCSRSSQDRHCWFKDLQQL